MSSCFFFFNRTPPKKGEFFGQAPAIIFAQAWATRNFDPHYFRSSPAIHQGEARVGPKRWPSGHLAHAGPRSCKRINKLLKTKRLLFIRVLMCFHLMLHVLHVWHVLHVPHVLQRGGCVCVSLLPCMLVMSHFTQNPLPVPFFFHFFS